MFCAAPCDRERRPYVLGGPEYSLQEWHRWRSTLETENNSQLVLAGESDQSIGLEWLCAGTGDIGCGSIVYAIDVGPVRVCGMCGCRVSFTLNYFRSGQILMTNSFGNEECSTGSLSFAIIIQREMSRMKRCSVWANRARIAHWIVHPARGYSMDFAAYVICAPYPHCAPWINLIFFPISDKINSSSRTGPLHLTSVIFLIFTYILTE